MGNENDETTAPPEADATEITAPVVAITAAAAAQQLMITGLKDMAAFLDVFTVGDDCTVTDLTGTVHHFAPAASARRTIRAARIARQMMEEQPAGSEAEIMAKVEESGRGAAMGEVLWRLVDDPANEDRIHQMFATLHGPRFNTETGKRVEGVLHDARAKAKEVRLEGMDGEIATNVLDLFETAEVVEGLLPFWPRVASRFGGTLRSLASRAPS